MTALSQVPSTVLALDVGERRIGVAIASKIARLSSPLTTIQNSESVLDDIRELVNKQSTTVLVVGLPRGLNGQDTPQTLKVRQFGEHLKALGLPIYWQDEAMTSKQAEAELVARSKPFKKEDIDALSACYILGDFLNNNPKVEI